MRESTSSYVKVHRNRGKDIDKAILKRIEQNETSSQFTLYNFTLIDPSWDIDSSVESVVFDGKRMTRDTFERLVLSLPCHHIRYRIRCILIISKKNI
jgi:hypothetical protein